MWTQLLGTLPTTAELDVSALLPPSRSLKSEPGLPDKPALRRFFGAGQIAEVLLLKGD